MIYLLLAVVHYFSLMKVLRLELSFTVCCSLILRFPKAARCHFESQEVSLRSCFTEQSFASSSISRCTVLVVYTGSMVIRAPTDKLEFIEKFVCYCTTEGHLLWSRYRRNETSNAVRFRAANASYSQSRCTDDEQALSIAIFSLYRKGFQKFE